MIVVRGLKLQNPWFYRFRLLENGVDIAADAAKACHLMSLLCCRGCNGCLEEFVLHVWFQSMQLLARSCLIRSVIWNHGALLTLKFWATIQYIVFKVVRVT